MTDATLEFVDKHLDTKYSVDILVQLLQVPTQVPLGAKTLMEPDDPKLIDYVQEVIRPELQSFECYSVFDAPLNQLVVELGSGELECTLLLMAYTPTQHNNLMRDPFSGKIAIPHEAGYDEPCAYGQGASQNKAHMAAMLAVLKLLVEEKVELKGKLYFAVNNEGRSSHQCSEAILGALPVKPDGAIILMSTDNEMKISLGNRGRVDIHVHVRGKTTHSSNPAAGLSAIDGANEVINRIHKMNVNTVHPQLGRTHAVVYQVVYEPMAPHTLPGYAKLTVDRRLLPGDSIEDAVTELRAAIGDMSPYEIEIETGVYMLPALVDPNALVVTALQAAVEQVRHSKPGTMYLGSSFDAGGPCAAGVPTVMWGIGGHESLLGDDFVPLAAVIDEARALSCMILEQLGAEL